MSRQEFKKNIIAGVLISFVLATALFVGQRAYTVRRGRASWYSRKSPGIKKRTANNEIFNDKAMTCAMWWVPFGQELEVTNIANGKSVVVRVNDRGPHKRFFRRGIIIDLTRAAFKKIASPQKGLIKVVIRLR